MLQSSKMSATRLVRLTGISIGNGTIPRVNASSAASRFFSTRPDWREDPSLYVTGMTKEDLKNADTLAYFTANFDTVKEESSLISNDNKPSEKGVLEEDEEESPFLKLNIRPLECFLRDPINEEGTNKCKSVRNQGFVPGIIYGKSHKRDQDMERILIKTKHNVVHRERDRYYRHFESRVYNLTVFDEHNVQHTNSLVVPSGVSYHPIKNMPICVNYIRYYPGRPINIPVKFTNEDESPVLKRGGFIVPIKRYLPCIIDDNVPIPEFIELDCTGVLRKQTLRLDRAIIPNGVTLGKGIPDDYLFGSVFGKNVEEEVGPDTVA